MLRRTSGFAGKRRLSSRQFSGDRQYTPRYPGQPGRHTDKRRVMSGMPGDNSKQLFVAVIPSIQSKAFSPEFPVLCQAYHRHTHIPHMHVSANALCVERDSLRSCDIQPTAASVPVSGAQYNRGIDNNGVQTFCNGLPHYFFRRDLASGIERTGCTLYHRCFFVNDVPVKAGIPQCRNRTHVT